MLYIVLHEKFGSGTERVKDWIPNSYLDKFYFFYQTSLMGLANYVFQDQMIARSHVIIGPVKQKYLA